MSGCLKVHLSANVCVYVSNQGRAHLFDHSPSSFRWWLLMNIPLTLQKQSAETRKRLQSPLIWSLYIFLSSKRHRTHAIHCLQLQWDSFRSCSRGLNVNHFHYQRPCLCTCCNFHMPDHLILRFVWEIGFWLVVCYSEPLSWLGEVKDCF